MRLEFWDWMVRGAVGWLPERDPQGRLVHPKPRWSSPRGARNHFGVEVEHGPPVWTFYGRMGDSYDELSDGRAICIGGEYDDYYDPDFCIYNDVVVIGPGEAVAIYGYPREVFPPTDFHSSGVLDDRIIVIGSVGYPGERRYGTTPVFALHLDDYRIEPLPSLGEPPGWIHKHDARIDGETILVTGGLVIYEDAGKDQIRRNLEDYAYHVPSGTWKRVTDRGWRQFTIELDGRGDFYVGEDDDSEGSSADATSGDEYVTVSLQLRNLVPRGAESFVPVSREEEDLRDTALRAMVGDVPVLVEVGFDGIEIVVEGHMEADAARAITEDLRRRIEAAGSGRRCVLLAHPTPGDVTG